MIDFQFTPNPKANAENEILRLKTKLQEMEAAHAKEVRDNKIIIEAQQEIIAHFKRKENGLIWIVSTLETQKQDLLNAVSYYRNILKIKK